MTPLREAGTSIEQIRLLAASILPLCALALGAGACASPGEAPPVAAPAAAADESGAHEDVPPVVNPRHEDWADAVLYFVIVDRFADGDASNNRNVDPGAVGAFHGGDFVGLTEQLDEIADLGVTAIWITPIVKNIENAVTGAGFPDYGYHGYWADDFNKMDSRFGTVDELQTFVAACHERGIRVLLDVVYNHAGYDSAYVRNPRTRSWLRLENEGECDDRDLTMCVGGLPDFRTELSHVAEYLLDAQLGWARISGVDGFRLDTVKHVGHPFWQEHRRRTRELLGDDFFLLGEVWGGDPDVLDAWFEPDEMDAGFDFSFQGNVLAFVQGRGRPVAFDRYLQRRERTRHGYLLSHYLSTHDTPGALYQLDGDIELFRLAAVIQFTSIGIPQIYYGEEVGRAGGDWPQNRSHMPWGEREVRPGAGEARDEQLRAFYKRLIEIRRRHPALTRGAHEGLFSEGDVLVYARRHEASNDVVIVAVNRGDAPATASIPVPEQWSGRAVGELLTGARLAPESGALSIEVAPRTAMIVAAD
jgi:alpha-amylase